MEYLKNAENLKSTTADCTDFAVKGITDICNAFGPRPCGSDSEKYAQAILVLPLKKKNAGKIYISEHEKDLVTYLYKKLNLTMRSL